ncbi:hypothetical protein MMUR_05590 [Mycolicibacterium murale]|uniref:Uncharacterized protein n=2 Tax=Mycolicibacterium murale TaxID=182220 RepID=A0A7I9WFC0_9MYCO|nr:hypothetical protein MMUR_05590 [Mycolicibacterium murale]
MDAIDSDPQAAVPNPGDEVKPKDLVSISAWLNKVPASVVWGWLSATRPLVYGTMFSFVRHGLPSWERERAESEVQAAILERNREVHHGADDGDD